MGKKIKPIKVYNTPCLDCGCYDGRMVKLGPLTFCQPCLEKRFILGTGFYDVETGEIDVDNSVYKRWLQIHQEREKKKAGL